MVQEIIQHPPLPLKGRSSWIAIFSIISLILCIAISLWRSSNQIEAIALIEHDNINDNQDVATIIAKRNQQCITPINQKLSDFFYVFAQYNHNTSNYFKTKKSILLANDNIEHNNDRNYAICEFQNQQFSHHFPHTMQQLYGCWAFWHQKLQQSTNEGTETKLVLILPTKAQQDTVDNPFVQGILDAWKSNAIKVISHSHELSLTAKEINSAKWMDIVGGYVLTHAKELRTIIFDYYGISLSKRRQKFKTACQENQHDMFPQIVILNRKPASGRSLLNAEAIQESLQSKYSFDNINVPILFMEGLSFVKQIRIFSASHIIISPHGAQLTGLPFASSTCSGVNSLLEIFPPKITLPEYYGSLATANEMVYSYIQYDAKQQDLLQQVDIITNSTTTSTTVTVNNVINRHQSRATNLCPDVNLVLQAVEKLVEHWQANKCNCIR